MLAVTFTFGLKNTNLNDYSVHDSTVVSVHLWVVLNARNANKGDPLFRTQSGVGSLSTQ